MKKDRKIKLTNLSKRLKINLKSFSLQPMKSGLMSKKVKRQTFHGAQNIYNRSSKNIW